MARAGREGRLACGRGRRMLLAAGPCAASYAAEQHLVISV